MEAGDNPGLSYMLIGIICFVCFVAGWLGGWYFKKYEGKIAAWILRMRGVR